MISSIAAAGILMNLQIRLTVTSKDFNYGFEIHGSVGPTSVPLDDPKHTLFKVSEEDHLHRKEEEIKLIDIDRNMI